MLDPMEGIRNGAEYYLGSPSETDVAFALEGCSNQFFREFSLEKP